MALWFNLACNVERIGGIEIRRRQYLDLSNPDAIQDAVSHYDVILDGCSLGMVQHRYGDGAWRLVAIAADLVASSTARSLTGGEA